MFMSRPNRLHALLFCSCFLLTSQAYAFDLTGAWATSADQCNKVFVKKGDKLGFAQFSEEFGGGFVADGNDVRSKTARCTIIIDTPNTYLYLVLGHGQAMRYGIGVGRDGFTWSGVQSITRKSEWPDWIPPAEMIARQPYLPRYMAGGPGNPLGARAMYLGGTVYRIHGTNAPGTIGTHVSSGCIRLTNEDVADLYSRVNVGTKVVVLPMDRRADNSVGRHG